MQPRGRLNLAELIATPSVAPLSRSLAIYGAGATGRSVARFLRESGYDVVAFVDAGKSGEVDGIPVRKPSWSDPGIDCLIALHNHYVDLADVRVTGFRRTLNMVDFYNLFPDQPWRYWIAPRSFYREHEDEIERARAMLGDDLSREWFDTVLAFRLTGDYSHLLRPTDDQYFPAGLPRWPSPMRYVDCGAYNGDTIEAFAGAGYAFDEIAAFEPDPENFATLSRLALPMRCFQSGVSDRARSVSFSAAGPSGKTGSGEMTIQCVAIDDAIPGFRPTLIKMDVEGDELDALRGARKTLEDRPGLAISLYHHPEHHWAIPLHLAALDLGYRFEIRGHTQQSFDTVLYAYPQ